jgi:hypothetical protein
MAACMILLAAPKLAAAMPKSDFSLVGRDDDLSAEAITVEINPQQVQQPITDPDELEHSPVPTPQPQTPQPITPSGQSTPVTPIEPEVFYAGQGCYSEPQRGGRALEHVWEDNAMTQQLCSDHAVAGGFAYFGLEYGKECWYGNTLRKGAAPRPDSECQKPCDGDPSQVCGDGQRLNLWRRTDAQIPIDQPTIGDYNLQGCYVDIVHTRALSRVKGDDAMTPQMCLDFCGGSTYMGLEYGRECWCGDVLDITSFNTDLDQCQMPCAGDLGSMCGGPNRIELYKRNEQPPAQVPYYSRGCYFDDFFDHGRALKELYADDNMTIQMCANFAARRGWNNFGLEYGRECWAGPELNPSAYYVADENCNMPCAGNDPRNCGGKQTLSLFSLTPNDIVIIEYN